MRHAISILLVALILVPGAFAIVDPDPDSIGLYFDLNADVYSISTPPATPVPVYVLATNPTYAQLSGYELGIDIVGSYTVVNVVMYGDNPLLPGGTIPGDYIVGFATPVPTSPATQLGTFMVMVWDANPVVLKVRGVSPSSVDDPRFPAVLVDQETIVALGPSGWDEATQTPTWCAAINSPDFVPLETVEATIDKVKSLYR